MDRIEEGRKLKILLKDKVKTCLPAQGKEEPFFSFYFGKSKEWLFFTPEEREFPSLKIPEKSLRKKALPLTEDGAQEYELDWFRGVRIAKNYYLLTGINEAPEKIRAIQERLTKKYSLRILLENEIAGIKKSVADPGDISSFIILINPEDKAELLWSSSKGPHPQLPEKEIRDYRKHKGMVVVTLARAPLCLYIAREKEENIHSLSQSLKDIFAKEKIKNGLKEKNDPPKTPETGTGENLFYCCFKITEDGPEILESRGFPPDTRGLEEAAQVLSRKKGIVPLRTGKTRVSRIGNFPEVYLFAPDTVPFREFYLFTTLLNDFMTTLEINDDFQKYKEMVSGMTDTSKTIDPIQTILDNSLEKLPREFGFFQAVVYREVERKKQKITYEKKMESVKKEIKEYAFPEQITINCGAENNGLTSGNISEALKIHPKSERISLEIYWFHDKRNFILVLRNDPERLPSHLRTLLDFHFHYTILKLSPAMIITNYEKQLLTAFASELSNHLCLTHYLIDGILKKKDPYNTADLTSVLGNLSWEIEKMEKRFLEYCNYKLPLENEKSICSLNSIISQAREKMGANMEKEYHFDIKSAVKDLLVYGIEKTIVNVIVQIFLNIRLHAYPGDVKGKGPLPEKIIHINGWNHNGHIHLEISDEGIGLSTEECDKAFLPGWKKDFSTNRNGLGLTLIRYVIETLHNGSITLSCGENKNSENKNSENKNGENKNGENKNGENKNGENKNSANKKGLTVKIKLPLKEEG